ncbi:MAG: glycosyltransferase family 2 protein [Candidatus Altiarchaeota archaeon]|nr:glycosyltransferase family 2 protein [Candidatus Altiarchaeota archaeon]
MKKLISVITHCYNEEANVEGLYEEVKKILGKNRDYDYEHIFIDNASEDKTVEILKKIAKKDKRLKIIVNLRNFGHIRSPFHGMLQCKGDAVISMASDFQDPPHLIPQLIEKWEQGYQVVLGVKTKSMENPAVFALRKIYYHLLKRMSNIQVIENFSGYALYDQKVIKTVRTIDDPYPYFRGLICDLGFHRATVEYTQPKRKQGITKNNIYTLYDLAVLGIISYSKIPLRLTIVAGLMLSLFSILTASGYLIYKLIYWDRFTLGLAPLVIGLFFFSSVQLLFLGVVGEYIGMIFTQVHKRPLVVEKERVNFG